MAAPWGGMYRRAHRARPTGAPPHEGRSRPTASGGPRGTSHADKNVAAAAAAAPSGVDSTSPRRRWRVAARSAVAHDRHPIKRLDTGARFVCNEFSGRQIPGFPGAEPLVNGIEDLLLNSVRPGRRYRRP